MSSDPNFLETSCIGLAGTHCVAGTSVGVVVATGDNSVFGKVNTTIIDLTSTC
jgi:sodium/potassium-transporting ATPase subunit alpha